ncbi:peptidylprolyl isomerase [Aurantiacibacter sp. MUD11]|uniref:peptidylprolyl isomerase n=1 Tax=Aurantiacibacter sp. MUD11 TaxID=3003265 RepID=UPI0022AB13E3|nr:peptidylprolyl isomerase [Aurantiacibacter sp. MUD11]WAT17911.1 peptidylprolyl isomerase [Aurantiacibacter sp. MUD11]
MSLIRSLLKEPLTHFVLLGGLLFAAYAVLNPRDTLDADSRVITVDREALLTFLQYRNAAFEPEYFEAQFDAMTDAQLAELARNYVREEAMEREARALGLDQEDYVIRRRLVQKIEYLVAGADLEPEPPTEEELRAYYDEHRADFLQDAEYTFTHVFIDAEKDHAGGMEAEARRLLGQLRARDAGFNDAPGYGDRFPYQRNFVRQHMRPVANIFGLQFAASLANLQPGETWQGPIASNFGLHLVLFTDRTAARTPAFEEVRQQVREAVLEERRVRTRETLLDDLVDQYDVRYVDIPAEPVD